MGGGTIEPALSVVGQCISTLFPDYMPYYERMLRSRTISSFNMFIMKHELFKQYSEWLFQVEGLFEEKWAALVGGRMGRACGEMGEYLLNVWLWYQMEKNHVVCRQLQTSMFYETALTPTAKQKLKAYLNKGVTILFPYGTKRRDYLLYRFLYQ